MKFFFAFTLQNSNAIRICTDLRLLFASKTAKKIERNNSLKIAAHIQGEWVGNHDCR